jgi:hypothetical protein
MALDGTTTSRAAAVCLSTLLPQLDVPAVRRTRKARKEENTQLTAHTHASPRHSRGCYDSTTVNSASLGPEQSQDAEGQQHVSSSSSNNNNDDDDHDDDSSGGSSSSSNNNNDDDDHDDDSRGGGGGSSSSSSSNNNNQITQQEQEQAHRERE